MGWYPNAQVVQGNSGGGFTSGPAKGVLHTTEGQTAGGAIGAYTVNNSWPHFTVTFENSVFEVFQHIDTSEGARALLNKSGGVQTNRDSAIQIEIVGTCNTANRDSWGEQYVENFPTAYLDGIAALMRWIEADSGVARIQLSSFLSYPDSYGADNGVRLSPEDWDNNSGWCGHQNVPENDHGDPGLLNIGYLLGVVPVAPEQILPFFPDVNVPSQPADPIIPNVTAAIDHPEVSQGSKGDAVRELQNKLNLLTGSGLTEDGDFGPRTEKALRNFQSFFGLVEDGIAGQITWKTLDDTLAQTGK